MIAPDTIDLLVDIVKGCSASNQKICIAGAKKSQGDQVYAPNALQIDMLQLNKVVSFDKQNKIIEVEAGMTWNRLQQFINAHGLAVVAMQSYNSFSIGGSIGVNAHGQDIHNSCLSSSIIALKVILSDGSVVNAGSDNNQQLFNNILGGYGLFGIVATVTLKLVDNFELKKQVNIIKSKDYAAYFYKNILNKKDVVLHSARLSIHPDKLFEDAILINYNNTYKKIENGPLQVHNNLKKEQQIFDLLRNFSWIKKIRFFLEKIFFEKSETVPRNFAMSSSIESIANQTEYTCDILQEYFIPCRNLNKFIPKLKEVVIKNKINLLNATIRYVPKIPDIALSYANENCFGIVLYINVENGVDNFQAASKWTKPLIDGCLELDGKFYLPYHLFATKEQLLKAYPLFEEAMMLKKIYDPKEIFVNQFYHKYAC